MFIWTVSDVIGLGAFAIIILVALCVSIYTFIKQAMCKHESCFENMRCHAICRKCGKDTGFIDDYRSRQRGNP